MQHTQGDKSLRLVPATSRGDKLHLVNWPFLIQILVPATSPTNSNQFEFLDQVPATQVVPQNALCGVNCSWDKSLLPVPSCKLFRELVAGASRRD